MPVCFTDEDDYTTLYSSARDEMSWDPKSAPKLDFDEDFYSVLEVDPSIASKDLKKAYYKMVFMYHPDNKEGNEAKAIGNKQMMVINGAYRILKNTALRAKYDNQRKNGLFGVKSGVKESDAVTRNTPPPVQHQSTEKKDVPPSRRPESNGNNRNSWYPPPPSTAGGRADFVEGDGRKSRVDETEPQPQRQRSSKYESPDKMGGFETETSSADTPRGVSGSSSFGGSMLDEVEEFLRCTDVAISHQNWHQITQSDLQKLKSGLRAKMLIVELGNTRDWGEVTDPKEVRRRLQDLKEVESLRLQILDLEEQIADLMLRGRVVQPSGFVEFDSRNSVNTGTRRVGPVGEPFDLWGEIGSSQSLGGEEEDDDSSLPGGDDQRRLNFAPAEDGAANHNNRNWRLSYESRRRNNPNRDSNSSTESSSNDRAGPRRGSSQSAFDELQKYFNNTKAKRKDNDRNEYSKDNEEERDVYD